MLLIFTKKSVFECSEADFLSLSILSDLMLLVTGVRKRAVHKECVAFGMKCIVHELYPKKNGYLAPEGVQNIIWIFSDLRVSTF